VFVWTSVESEVDCGFVAGLIAGDGHFLILPNNCGSTWACGLAMRLRADDTPLLASICRWSGVGRLSAISARRGSKPQTLWLVQRQAECLRIMSILDRPQLLGKKLGEYAIWRSAVVAWTSKNDDRHEVVAKCAEQLRSHRRFDNAPDCAEVDITDERLLAFFAGFVTAEAHFGASSGGHPSFRINLRRDDGGLLRLFHDRLTLGRLADVPPYRTSKAAVSWRVGRLAELRALTELLDRYPPRGRVLRIYEAWRELVLLRDRRRRSTRQELALEVRTRRAYKPGLETIIRPDRIESRRARHVTVLRAWASETDGARTSTAYESWRRAAHPDAPTRDTVAAAFGSWVAALDATGLCPKGCRTQEANATAQRTGAAGRRARSAAQRSAILDAVRECSRQVGHLPRATEFFAWRNRFASDLPSHTTVYRVFPGGWQEVLAAVG
jgi:hypothetical protein